MISQMDQIYSSAYLTIVAAAGLDAHTGLPGVSRFHRQQLQEVHVGDTHLVQLPRPALATIMSSPWASRGWTFQECCLAGRRLIFTEDQTLFLCNKSFVTESVKQRIIKDNWVENYLSHLVSRPTMHGNTSQTLLKQTQEYSRRNISYDSDSLNAFLGVLHHWETRLAKTKKPMSHLWGLPIRGAITHGPGGIDFYFVWHYTYRDAVRVRRPDFPSWSWAGWAGPKSFPGDPIHLAETEKGQDQFGVYISVQSDDQITQTLADFHKDSVARTRKSLHYRPGPIRLLVTCAVFPIRVQNFQLSEDERDAKTELQLGRTRELRGRPKNGNLLLCHISENIRVGISRDSVQQVQPDERLSGLILHCASTYHWFLVVKQVEEALYERVDLCHWSSDEEMLFLSTEGCILGQVDLPGKEVFPAKFERRTVCLV